MRRRNCEENLFAPIKAYADESARFRGLGTIVSRANFGASSNFKL